MSFLRHREIYPSDGGLTLSAKPPLIVWMSFRLAIPRRVALQHCPPPLHQPATFCYDPLRSSTKFRRTATCPSFLCLTRGAHPRLRPGFPPPLRLAEEIGNRGLECAPKVRHGNQGQFYSEWRTE